MGIDTNKDLLLSGHVDKGEKVLSHLTSCICNELYLWSKKRCSKVKNQRRKKKG